MIYHVKYSYIIYQCNSVQKYYTNIFYSFFIGINMQSVRMFMYGHTCDVDSTIVVSAAPDNDPEARRECAWRGGEAPFCSSE